MTGGRRAGELDRTGRIAVAVPVGVGIPGEQDAIIHQPVTIVIDAVACFRRPWEDGRIAVVAVRKVVHVTIRLFAVGDGDRRVAKAVTVRVGVPKDGGTGGGKDQRCISECADINLRIVAKL